jgi:hypothetical protein
MGILSCIFFHVNIVRRLAFLLSFFSYSNGDTGAKIDKADDKTNNEYGHGGVSDRKDTDGKQ